MSMEVDLYAFFSLSEDCTLKEIKKAYKQKARELHPDKNKENPLAKEEFQQLRTFYEVLHNPVTKKEYDQKWKAKREARKKLDAMDSSRRKMKQDLEAKEAAAQDARKKQKEVYAKEAMAEKIRREWEKHTEEVQWETQRKHKLFAEKNDHEIKISRSNYTVVKVKWNVNENPQASACYTESFIKTCLSEFGDINTLVMNKRGTAVAEFSSYNGASEAVKASENGSVGLPNLPLQVSIIHKSTQMIPDPDLMSTKNRKTADLSSYKSDQYVSEEPNLLPESGNSFTSFEQDILSRMANFGQ